MSSYLAHLNFSPGAIVFTAGIGENSPFLRERVLRGFDNIGCGLDAEKNEANERDISPLGQKARILVIPTNEEKQIATEAFRLLDKQ
jgi:acetate kinase